MNNASSDPLLAAILKYLVFDVFAMTAIILYGKKIVGLACVFLGVQIPGLSA